MSHDVVKLSMQVVISLALLGVGLFVLLAGTGSQELQKLAAGWIGAVVMFWLK